MEFLFILLAVLVAASAVGLLAVFLLNLLVGWLLKEGD